MKILTSKQQEEIAKRICAVQICVNSLNSDKIETLDCITDNLANICYDACGVKFMRKVVNTFARRSKEQNE